MKQPRKGVGESGQAAVESAIILPLYIFLLLGILQLGLMHQVRLVTKYAAYKAVRAGALNNARRVVMERAALAVLLPLVSRELSGGEFIKTLNNANDFRAKWNWPEVKENMDMGLPYVEVTTCGPSHKELGDSAQELDFDDPQVAASEDWRASQRTKLRIQVTFNYRMPIPFANWVIHSAAFNRELPGLMRMGSQPRKVTAEAKARAERYVQAADQGRYVLPIRAAYTLRMQSNVYVEELPEANTCLTTNRY